MKPKKNKNTRRKPNQCDLHKTYGTRESSKKGGLYLETAAALVVGRTQDVVNQLQTNLLAERVGLSSGNQIQAVARILLIATVHCEVFEN